MACHVAVELLSVISSSLLVFVIWSCFCDYWVFLLLRLGLLVFDIFAIVLLLLVCLDTCWFRLVVCVMGFVVGGCHLL